MYLEAEIGNTEKAWYSFTGLCFHSARKTSSSCEIPSDGEEESKDNREDKG